MVSPLTYIYEYMRLQEEHAKNKARLDFEAHYGKIEPQESDFDGWPRISEVSKRTGLNKGVVSRLLDTGELRDNKLTGNLRRVDPSSVLTYCGDKGITYNET